MKNLACKELGEIPCDFIASGETDEEVKNKMFDHIETNHIIELLSGRQLDKLEKKMERILLYQ